MKKEQTCVCGRDRKDHDITRFLQDEKCPDRSNSISKGFYSPDERTKGMLKAIKAASEKRVQSWYKKYLKEIKAS